MANAAMCASGALKTDVSACNGGGTTAPAAVCSDTAVQVCRTSCPKQQFLTCICPVSPTSPEFTCLDVGLGGGIIAGIVIGALVVVFCLIGLVYYLAKPTSGDVVVVDKSGKKIKLPRPAPSADGSTVLSGRAIAQRDGNPGADGLWYCAVSGDPTCNRAYMSSDELNLHIQKRHPNLPVPMAGGGGLTLANPAFDSGPPPMGLQSNQSFPMLQTAQSMTSFNPAAQTGPDGGAIFKCQFPGCNRGYMFESDLQTHIQFRHAGGADDGGLVNGASVAFRPQESTGWGASGNPF